MRKPTLSCQSTPSDLTHSLVTMIRTVIVMSTQGKPRLTKFHDFQPPEKQQELIRMIYGVLCNRPKNVSNFIQADDTFGPDSKLVCKHLATPYFIFIKDGSDNELAMLDLIRVFVEKLDRCFKNVCEIDVVFKFNKMHTVLNEVILGGQVLETSSEEVMKVIEEISRLRCLHPQSVSSPSLLQESSGDKHVHLAS